MAVFDVSRSLADRIANQEMPPYIYTYPPKGAYQPFTDWEQAAKSWEKVEGHIAIYIHIPFCNMKCSFCNLFTVTNAADAIRERYVAALLLELQVMMRFLNKSKLVVSSLYFGGGTPSLLTQSQLDRLLGAFRMHFKIASNAEVSIEGTPDTFNARTIRELISLGFNRVSMGVQTFQPDHLKKMGRHYPAELAQRAGEEAVASGIRNVNMDFIYGTPEQILDQWRDNLEKVLKIGPTTLTAYPLVVRQKTVFGRQKLKGLQTNFPDEKIKYDWYDFTYDVLTKNGYQQHTFVSYAKQDGGCRHEENEFSGHPTLSFGAGARKYAPDLHYVDEDYVQRLPTNTTMMEYMEAVEGGRILVKSAARLDANEQILRYAILGLLAGGIDKGLYDNKFGEPIEERFSLILEALVQEKLMQASGRGYGLTQLGKKYSSIIGSLMSSPEVANLMWRYK